MVEELFALDELYWPVISGNPEVDPNGVLGNCNYLGPRLNRQEPRASTLGHELILTPMSGPGGRPTFRSNPSPRGSFNLHDVALERPSLCFKSPAAGARLHTGGRHRSGH